MTMEFFKHKNITIADITDSLGVYKSILPEFTEKLEDTKLM